MKNTNRMPLIPSKSYVVHILSRSLFILHVMILIKMPTCKSIVLHHQTIKSHETKNDIFSQAMLSLYTLFQRKQSTTHCKQGKMRRLTLFDAKKISVLHHQTIKSHKTKNVIFSQAMLSLYTLFQRKQSTTSHKQRKTGRLHSIFGARKGFWTPNSL